MRIEVLREFLAEEGRLRSADALAIIYAAADIFRHEPTVVTVSAPVTSLFHPFLLFPYLTLNHSFSSLCAWVL